MSTGPSMGLKFARFCGNFLLASVGKSAESYAKELQEIEDRIKRIKEGGGKRVEQKLQQSKEVQALKDEKSGSEENSEDSSSDSDEEEEEEEEGGSDSGGDLSKRKVSPHPDVKVEEGSKERSKERTSTKNRQPIVYDRQQSPGKQERSEPRKLCRGSHKFLL